MTLFAFEWTPREKWIATIAGGILIILGILFWADQEDEVNSEKMEVYAPTKTKDAMKKEGSTIDDKEKMTQEQVVVDVKGAVERPGIYTMTAPVRIYQVIQQAGGVVPDGDTSSLNLAEQVVDGSVLYVPRKGETPPDMATTSIGSQTPSNKTSSSKININTATAEELDKLNGLGPSKANAIVEYRKEHGKFQKIEDLTQVPGIGEKTIEQFRDQVEVR